MNGFNTIENELENLKKPFLGIALTGAFVNIAILALWLTIHITAPDKRFSALETCFHGMKSIFEHTLNKDLLDKSLLDALEKKTFKIDRITLVKEIDGFTCDVITQDAKGHRAYRVSLAKDGDFKHLYKILNIRGQKIKSNYQWRDTR